MRKVARKRSIGILGAGAFGTALAFVYRSKFEVTFFSCFEEHVNSMRRTRVNGFFTDFVIPSDVKIELAANLSEHKYDYLLWVFPIKPSPGILESLKVQMNGTDVIVCSKGILLNSSFICDLFQKELPASNIGYLSGANFATELASGKMSMADVASYNLDAASRFASELSTENFRLKPSDDLVGAQISGALKNIVAIACGIAYGLNLGENAHAALVTMALSEMSELGVKLGAKKETFYGFCGLADLILTASSTNSRNTSLGIAVARGKSAPEVLQNSTCEGYDTLPQIIELARKSEVRLPICETVNDILFNHQSPSIIIDVFK